MDRPPPPLGLKTVNNSLLFIEPFFDLDRFPTHTAEGLNFLDKLMVLVQLGDVIGSADTLPVDHNVGYRPTACHLAQLVLYLLAEWVYVQFDNVWLGSY